LSERTDSSLSRRIVVEKIGALGSTLRLHLFVEANIGGGVSRLERLGWRVGHSRF